MLKQRVLSAAVLIPVVILGVYLGGWPIYALVLLAVGGALWEFGDLVSIWPEQPSMQFGMLLLGLLLFSDGQFPGLGLAHWGLLVGTLGLLSVQVFLKNAPGSLNRWALAVAGAGYIGYSGSFFLRLRAHPQGLALLVLALAATWICDSGAYFVGRAYGRRKLAPHISPKKSWEGVLGGLVSGLAAVMLIGCLWVEGFTWWHGLLLGVLVTAAAVIGDLAESVVKRQVGAKDSGKLIPGHGGALDRIDSLLFVVPLVFGFVRLLGI